MMLMTSLMARQMIATATVFPITGTLKPAHQKTATKMVFQMCVILLTAQVPIVTRMACPMNVNLTVMAMVG